PPRPRSVPVRKGVKPVSLVADLSLMASAVPGEDADLVLPPPHGWIGTTDEWARGFGIAFVLLAILLLVIGWLRLRRVGLTGPLKEVLILPLVVLPAMIVF